MRKLRKIKQVVNGVIASDGDGVKLTRIIGSVELNMLDPFLLFDAFGSDKPLDYIGGFPPHPHRGFETVTYMLAGKMRHEDSAGNRGLIETGGVQWMTAGRGIIHSEMPEQEDGLLAGFQLWVNLPAEDKMVAPRYQEKAEKDIPVEIRKTSKIKVIAGKTKNGTNGLVKNGTVQPVYWDVKLKSNSVFSDFIPQGHNLFIYIIEGELTIGNSETKLKKTQLVILNDGDLIEVKTEIGSRFLVIAGRPIGEPVERGGPFVMNTKEEIHQAFNDYQTGRLA